ncbi:MAG: RsmD family RNA methyltransferase [Bacteroidota bacterium]
MRITGGRLGRRRITGPPTDKTRPTTDRVREALFSALASRMDLREARVLDLFAGTGALGLEAISRGAAHATFVDSHGPTLGIARRNARDLDVADQCTFVRAEALAHIARLGPEAGAPGRFDLVLADPPYALDALADLPARLRPLLASGGLLALEHDARHDFSADPACAFSRDYGTTRVSIFEVETPS